MLCERKAGSSRSANLIERFDARNLLRLGKPGEQDGRWFARIDAIVPVDAIRIPSADWADAASDIVALGERTDAPTSRQALIDARIGQGRYRIGLLALWDGRCAVTGCAVREVLRASHVKRWRDSSDTERLDARNGLPLVATLDALFDAGLISFDDGGNMLVSSGLESSERGMLGVPAALRRKPDTALRRYLAEHRATRFRP